MIRALEGSLLKSRLLFRGQFQYRCLSNKGNNGHGASSQPPSSASTQPTNDDNTKGRHLELGKQLKSSINGGVSKDRLRFTTINVKPIPMEVEKKPLEDVAFVLKSYTDRNRLIKFVFAPITELVEFIRLPKHEKIDMAVRGGFMFIGFLITMILVEVVTIYFRIGEHEITGRMFVNVLIDTKLKYLDEYLCEQMIKDFEGRFKPSDDKTLSEMERILSKLLQDNAEYIEDERFKEVHACILIDEKTPQQLTLYSHNFYVFTTGLMELCENEHQRAYVIANSVAHHLLKHAREVGNDYSLTGIFARMKLFYYSAIACFGMKISIFKDIPYLEQLDELDHESAKFFYRLYRSVTSKLLYDKDIEAEADRIAMQLLSRSCYDIRQAEVFADKCATLAQKSPQEVPKQTPDRPILPIANYLLRHGFNNDKLSYLQSIMDKFIKFRLECKCAPLS